MTRAAKITLGLIALLALLATLRASPLTACPIPVFQYSLEHWEPDPYDVVVHHDGQFTEQQQAALEMLRKAERGEPQRVNLTVVLRDHSGRETPSRPGQALPRIEVRYPIISGLRQAVWTGDLTGQAVRRLLDSPVRQQVAAHLRDRKAAVWVLLESGNRHKDREALERLEKELPRLAKTLEVADPDGQFGLEPDAIQRDIDFAVLSVSCEDPEEQVLVNLLLGIEHDLSDFEDTPLVFPIYGRGLVMYALVGDGINKATMDAAGEFLVGPCSCQVKAANPGVDVLMPVDWAEGIEPLSKRKAARPQAEQGVAGPQKEAGS